MSIDSVDQPGRDHGARRVLWLIKGLGRGGAETLLTFSARASDRATWFPSVCYLLEQKNTLVDELEALGVTTTCLRVRDVADPRWPARLRRLLRDERFDIVHVHSPLVAFGARLVVRSLPRHQRPRLVSTEHNLWSSHRRITAALNSVSYPLDDAHLAVSGTVRDSLPYRHRLTTEIVRHGVDVGRIRSECAGRPAVRAQLGLGIDEPVVTTVANLRATKGYRDLLQAARLVVDSEPDVQFVSVGQGPLAEELTQLRDELDLKKNFRFLGYRPDAVDIVSASDIFCMASHHEGLPVAMMESLAVGVPIVATSVGGVPELVEDGREAILVPPHRPRDLAAALVRVLTEPALHERMAAAAAAAAVDLDVTNTVRRTEQIYDEVVRS